MRHPVHVDIYIYALYIRISMYILERDTVYAIRVYIEKLVAGQVVPQRLQR